MTEEKKVRRAHFLRLEVGADSLEDLESYLCDIVRQIKLGELTQGCMGGYSVGSIYEYIHDPEMTHDKYAAYIQEMTNEPREV